MNTELKKKFSFEIDQAFAEAPPTKKHGYIIEPGLYEAVRLSLLLNQPLLLTGRPGTGKTELAYKLAQDLHEEYPDDYHKFPLVFNTKTTSTFTDLFYTYDALGHFRASNFGTPGIEPDVQQFIQLQALGQAIMLSNRQHWAGYRSMQEISTDIINSTRDMSSIVLLDEVDKAPRDFANDLLNELDNFEFAVKEDKHTRYGIGMGKILIILTSNSEKNLPDAFLRRCLFYHIEFPKAEMLQKIIIEKLFPDLNNQNLTGEQQLKVYTLDSYIEYFQKLRSTNLKKEPATAELVSWIYYLRKQIHEGIHWANIEPGLRIASLSIIAKHSEDYQLLKDEIRSV